MDHLDEISVEKLQDALDNVEGNKPTQRLLAAITYKNGVAQTELAEWHGTGRRTIYSWLMRFDTDEPLGKLHLMLIDPGENEKSQNHSKKSSNARSTNLPKKSESTRRRGRRRSSKIFSKIDMASSTPIRVVGGC